MSHIQRRRWVSTAFDDHPSQAKCVGLSRCYGPLPCPRHTPLAYAARGAKHRRMGRLFLVLR